MINARICNNDTGLCTTIVLFFFFQDRRYIIIISNNVYVAISTVHQSRRGVRIKITLLYNNTTRVSSYY